VHRPGAVAAGEGPRYLLRDRRQPVNVLPAEALGNRFTFVVGRDVDAANRTSATRITETESGTKGP
jgi:hypothetical protein